MPAGIESWRKPAVLENTRTAKDAACAGVAARTVAAASTRARAKAMGVRRGMGALLCGADAGHGMALRLAEAAGRS
ncbi:hypothetical protein Afe04nite_80510 [Asanoa ferruginea]|nr:hypothetical protein Afe04nite_80510 [Asanoa ferruginea]